MNCPNCENEIKENQKFCKKCGYEIKHIANTERKAIVIVVISFIIVIMLILLSMLITFSNYKKSLAEKQRLALIRTFDSITTCTNATLNKEKKKYTNPDDIFNLGIVPKLNLKQHDGNKIVMADGTIVTYKKLKNICNLKTFNFTQENACYELTMETDIKFLDKIKIQNDQKTFKFYGLWIGVMPDSESMKVYKNFDEKGIK